MRSPYERLPRFRPARDDLDRVMARLDPTGETACDEIMREQRQTNNPKPRTDRSGASALRGHNS